MTKDITMLTKKLSLLVDHFTWYEEREILKSKFSDLTIKEYHVIVAIVLSEKATAKQIADKMQLTPGTLTVTSDRLVAKGYIKRTRDKEDRRVIRIDLTKRGRDLMEYRDQMIKKAYESFTEGFSEDDLARNEKAIDNLISFLA
ncbi:MAG: MarR family transcriptional regulator [Lactobacillus sp.]|nr:MarR family transcriptional regulator [Lactobacillus sp.]